MNSFPDSHTGDLPPDTFEKEMGERGPVSNVARVTPVIRITPRAPVAQVPQPTKLVRVTSSPIKVERAQIPYLRERGWCRRSNSNEYFGRYKVHNVSFAGKAKESPCGDVEMFIRDDDALESAMAGHHKWACFFVRPDGWLFVHASGHHIRDVSAGLIEVEAILAEAYEGRQKQEHKAHTHYHERPRKFSVASFIIDRILH